MKAIFLALAFMTFGVSASAMNPIDEQINKAQGFIPVGMPTYQGRPFLAYSAREDYEVLQIDNIYALQFPRAEKICKLMGYKKAAAYKFANSPGGVQGAYSMWETMGELVLYSYANRSHSSIGLRYGYSAYFSDLVCQN